MYELTAEERKAILDSSNERCGDNEIKKTTWTLEKVYAYCEAQRGPSRFCSKDSSCSGPCPSNLASDADAPEGVTVWRGGHHGWCSFDVLEG